MKTLLKIQSSLFNGQGQSSALARRVADHWLEHHPDGRVITRDLGQDPVPHLDLERFQALTAAPEVRSDAQREVVAYSDGLIAELKSADVIVLAVPMYNFTVPSALHAYFDHVARAGETFRYTEKGPEGLVTGKKAYVVVTRGGVYGEDHSQTRFIQQFLGFIGITDVEFIYAEGLKISEREKAESLARAEQRIAGLLGGSAAGAGSAQA